MTLRLRPPRRSPRPRRRSLTLVAPLLALAVAASVVPGATAADPPAEVGGLTARLVLDPSVVDAAVSGRVVLLVSTGRDSEADVTRDDVALGHRVRARVRLDASVPPGTEVAYRWRAGRLVLGTGHTVKVPARAGGRRLVLVVTVTAPGVQGVTLTRTVGRVRG